ncbi:S8 family serine peptidase [uncultured Tenacibaculum sp.]|uniref:S8 family serine peptidase n=1 Tax=uncultured Tenacibaculum sp. TaxID=174713 RepID=UPI002633D75E|nr:S8 family serine peptidase [uncultured Tenacibaculum sp.]
MKNNYCTKLLLFAGLLSLGFQSNAQNKKQIEQIRSQYNLTKLQKIEKSIESKENLQRKEAVKIAKQQGWETSITTKDGVFLQLQKVIDGTPVYYKTFNVDAARSTRTNHLNNGGSLGLNLMGQGMTAHVWDGGIARASHQEYDGAGGNNRFSVGDGSSTLNFHAAHVTGTIIASGVQADAKGMAPHASAVGYFWDNDQSEATSAAASGMLVSNHSYGFAARNPNTGQVQLPQYFFGGYIDESRAWDEILFNAPNYLMVVAAGNDGNDNTANSNPTGGSGWDKLTGHSTSKNNLVVANAQDANIDANGNLISVSINSSSSEGPTDDFRIKPDITGNGTGVYSTYHNSNSAYNSITGTSMASPNVAGSLLLLQQHYNNVNGNFMRAATLKGLALHTADDAGASGPDAVFGWGLLNAKRAAETITANGAASKIEELTLTAGQTYTITVDSDGTSPLLASISWTDRPGTAVTTVNSTTPVLVNDLDIRVSKGGTQFLPYELTGPTTNAKRDNNVDPYERVDVSNASGSYTITVTHKGTLTGGSQAFTLIVTGVTGTPAVCNATTPTGVNVNGVSQTGATVNWSAVAGTTYDVRYRVAGTSSWTTTAVSGTSLDLSGLTAATQYQVQVRSKCPDGTNSSYSSSTTFTTSAPAACQSLPYSESFESNDGWTQVGGDDGDWVRDSGGTPSSTTGPSSGADGSFYMFLEASTNGSTGQIGNNATAILESGCFDLSGKSSAAFTFQNHMYGTDMGSLTVQASSNDGASWTNIWTQSGNQGNQWNSVSVDLASYLGSTIKLRIVGTTGNGWRSDVAIDNLGLTAEDAGSDTQAPSAPSNVQASSITKTTATVSWSASSDNVGVTGYEVFQGSTSLGTVTGTSANLTGLTADTSYTISVRAQDAAGNQSAAGSVTFTTESDTPAPVSYCASSGNRTQFEWIDNVELGGIANATGAGSGYSDFTSQVGTLARGSSNSMIVSAGFSGQAYTEFWAVWIDFNRNGTFEDSEKVVSGSSSSANNLSATVAVPSDAVLGQTRMRVSMKYNAAQTACESFADGEVEDYTINIVASTSSSSLFATFSDADALGNEDAISVAAYPNPATNFVQVKLSSRDAVLSSYTIVNTIGQTVQKGVLTSERIDISKLNSGVYILKVNDTQKEIKTLKLVKR